MAGRPRLDTEVHRVTVYHARFHLGAQLGGKAYQSLDYKMHEKQGIEMEVDPSETWLRVKLDGHSWVIPQAIIHSLRLTPNKE